MSFDPPASDVNNATAPAGGAAARVRLPVAPSPGLPRFSSPADIDDFVAGLHRYERGEMTPDEFRVFRLGRGTYGQRQMDVHMLRVKAPQGVITAEQLEVYARLASEFSRGFGHV